MPDSARSLFQHTTPPAAPAHPPQPQGPTTGEVSSLKRAGLTTQLEIHDRTQIEIRFAYAIGSEPGPQRYTVDAYFFIPRNVGVNRLNFTREAFYGDVTALMRLDAAPLPLEQLADENFPPSPLHRFARALELFRTSPRPPPSRPVAVHVKLYAYLFTLGIKAALGRLQRQLKEATGKGEREQAAVERELQAALGRFRDALWAYRRVRAGFWPFEQLSHHSFPEAMRSADEYMSLYLEERLALFVAQLERDPKRLDGSGWVARLRLACAALAEEESAYRHKYGYLTLTSRSLVDGEYFTYRASHLKKAVQQALYLDPREVRADTFLRNAVGSVAAALGAIWALATQLPATIADVSGSTKMFFFSTFVLAYVMKDRIKAVTNEYLTSRLRKHDHTSWLVGESLATVGLGMLQARLREAMRFTSQAELPRDVVQLRLSRRTVRNAEAWGEEVIHYRKQLEVGTRDEAEPLPDGYWVRDILRLNVRHFLVRLDDPLDRVPYFDARSGSFQAAELPKVYHLNVVLKVTRENVHGQGQERLEHLRIVLNKDGVVRVDEVESVGPLPIQTQRRFTLPFFPNGV